MQNDFADRLGDLLPGIDKIKLIWSGSRAKFQFARAQFAKLRNMQGKFPICSRQDSSSSLRARSQAPRIRYNQEKPFIAGYHRFFCMP